MFILYRDDSLEESLFDKKEGNKQNRQAGTNRKKLRNKNYY